MNHRDMYCNNFNLRKYFCLKIFLVQVCKNIKSSCSCTELRKAFVKKRYKYKTTISTNMETHMWSKFQSRKSINETRSHVLQCSEAKAASSHAVCLSGVIRFQSGQKPEPPTRRPCFFISSFIKSLPNLKCPVILDWVT